MRDAARGATLGAAVVAPAAAGTAEASAAVLPATTTLVCCTERCAQLSSDRCAVCLLGDCAVALLLGFFTAELTGRPASGLRRFRRASAARFLSAIANFCSALSAELGGRDVGAGRPVCWEAGLGWWGFERFAAGSPTVGDGIGRPASNGGGAAPRFAARFARAATRRAAISSTERRMLL